MRMPQYAWRAYADRAPLMINETIARMGIAAMMPYMLPQQRASLLASLQRRRTRVIKPTSIREAAADAAMYGIQFEDARTLN